MLASLCAELAAMPQIMSLVDTLAHAPRQMHTQQPFLRVAPLIGAARIPFVAACATALCHNASESPTPQSTNVLLYVVKTPEQAIQAHADLSQWFSPEHSILFPANDALPYEHMTPDKALIGQRLQCMQRLAAMRTSPTETPSHSQCLPLIIVAPIKAVLQPTLAPHDINHATTHITMNAWLSQDTVLRRWLDLGYHMTPLVEEPGEMTRRGGIVDIWPTADPLPLRIEWFGDEIDSLRRFNPQTQRSEQRLHTVAVGPPLEIPYWQREHVHDALDALEVDTLRPEVLDEWETNKLYLKSGGRVERWSYLAPFFYWPHAEHQPDTAPANVPHALAPSLLDHMPPGSTVFLSEATLLEQAADTLHNHLEQQRDLLIAAGELPPDFPRAYLLWQELWEPMPQHQHTTVDLSSKQPLETALPTHPSHDRKGVDRETKPLTYVRGSDSFPPRFAPANLFGGDMRRCVRDIVALLRKGERVVVVSPYAARIQEILEQQTASRGYDEALLVCMHATLSEGWRLPELAITLYTDAEIFGSRQRATTRKHVRQSEAAKRQAEARRKEHASLFLRGLKPGEYVVHIDHGIALYEGLVRRVVGGVEREYLNLRYANGDRLYVPFDHVDRIARYVGTGAEKPKLTRLGTQDWEQARRKARDAVHILAHDLLELYAQRKLSTGYAFSADTDWQYEMEQSFPYTETDDQLRAWYEVKTDMESSIPMDRLMCGDVGFGKTEVALRAAFKAVQDSKQVAVLVPTTVLAQQHVDTFRQRLNAFPVQVEMLSRFRSPKEQRHIVQRLSRGDVDIIIGTHRLLSKDVFFKELGLLIIDEEQRFGVRHKERLKQLRTEIDVLTLTATPIPRTLHMSLAGIRDMSVIDTPPEARVPIKTYVAPYNKQLVRDAIQRELNRNGQVYFLHNRVSSIERVAEGLRKLVPEAKIGIGHGQLHERTLEKVMLDFFKGEYDILACTTIIENGLDVPNANTIIIDDAPNYGLAQLYQLRGRVGRSGRRAYAYLLHKPKQALSSDAVQRLQAIEEATELGAGFRIAMRDLEIRGAGNLLGDEQSGHIAAVGFDLYSRMLEQAVEQLRTTERQDIGALLDDIPQTSRAMAATRRDVLALWKGDEVTLNVPLSAYLPEDYVEDVEVRLDIYQHMATIQSIDDVQKLRRDLRDRFGELPLPAIYLLSWLRIRILAINAGVRSIVATDEEIHVQLPDSTDALERLKRRFGETGDRTVQISGPFARLNLRCSPLPHARGSGWVDKLVHVLEVLGHSSS